MTEFEKSCEYTDGDSYTGDTDQENCVEFINRNKTASATFSQKSWVTRMQRLAAKHPDEVRIVHVNKSKDGSVISIVVQFPVSYLHISSKKRTTEMTDEQKQKAAARLAVARENRHKKVST